MKFDKLLILLEGGNAVKNSGRIHKQKVISTYEKIKKDLFPALKVTDSKLIGSSGKKETSGDIDIGIITEITPEEISDYLSKTYETYKRGNLVSFSYDGMQIDLIITDSLDYVDFSYYSPEKSKYSGLHRTELLKAIARVMEYKVDEKFDDGEAKVISRIILDPNRGLMKAKDTYESTKTGNRVKSKQKLSRDIITNDPEKIVKLLLGDNAKLSDAESFESIFSYLKSGKSKHNNETIKKILEEYVNEIDRKNEINNKKDREKIQVPVEIKNV